MQATEFVDRGLQGLLGAGEVGDVDRIERAADAGRDVLAVRTLAVEHRDTGPARGQQLGAGAAHARGAADDDHLLAVDLHPYLLVGLPASLHALHR